jgi:hypothetical protein
MSELDVLNDGLRAVEEAICETEALAYSADKDAAAFGLEVQRIQDERLLLKEEYDYMRHQDVVDLAAWREAREMIELHDDLITSKQNQKWAFLRAAKNARETRETLLLERARLQERLAEWGVLVVLSIPGKA